MIRFNKSFSYQHVVRSHNQSYIRQLFIENEYKYVYTVNTVDVESIHTLYNRITFLKLDQMIWVFLDKLGGLVY